MEALHRTMQGAIGAGCDSGSQEPYQQLMHSMVQVGHMLPAAVPYQHI